MSKKNGGWTGSALLPFVLLSEKLDSNFLVVGISPFNNPSGGEELTEEQQVRGLRTCAVPCCAGCCAFGGALMALLESPFHRRLCGCFVAPALCSSIIQFLHRHC
jgi:hypothetical protein